MNHDMIRVPAITIPSRPSEIKLLAKDKTTAKMIVRSRVVAFELLSEVYRINETP